MKYGDIPRILTMTIVWLLLLVWNLNAHRSGCLASLGLLVLFTLVLLISGAEYALAERRAFVAALLIPGRGLYGWYHVRHPLIAVEVVKAVFLAILLLTSALTFAPRQWSILFAAVLFVGLLLPRLYAGLAGQVREGYRFAMARHWALIASVGFLWIESLLVLFFSAGENFMGLRWQEAITLGAAATDVSCGLIAQGAASLSAIEAMGHWSVQNLHRSVGDLPQFLMAAVSLTTAVFLLFLRAYVFSLALLGVVARPWDLWREAAITPPPGTSVDRI